MTGIDIYLNKLTYNEIKNIKLLKSNQTIPTFKEVLNLVNGKVLLDIEIKDTKKIKTLCQKLVIELDKYNHSYIIHYFLLVVKFHQKKIVFNL